MRRTRAAAGSALFFALAPGVVAGVVPWLLTGWQLHDSASSLALPPALVTSGRVLGALLLAAAIAVLVHAFARFAIEGLGTPAPIAPTERLVVGGLYRYVRNPMYVAVVSAIIGQALLLGQPILLPYAAVVCAIMMAFVRFYEEPVLTRRFGDRYLAYRRAVPGWLPRLRPWTPDDDDRSAHDRDARDDRTGRSAKHGS